MMQNQTALHEMEVLLNSSFMQNTHAQEYNMAHVNGYFVGVSTAIRSLGFCYRYDSDLHHLVVSRDPDKTCSFHEYEIYTARMADDHWKHMMKCCHSEDDSSRIREHSVIEGMNEVLKLFGRELYWRYDRCRYDVRKSGKGKMS